MKDSKKIEKAHRNLLALRDKAFFDKLKKAYGIVPDQGKNRGILLRMVNDLVSEQGKTSQQSRNKRMKQSLQSAEKFVDTMDEEPFIQELATMLASDPELRESAQILYEMMG